MNQKNLAEAKEEINRLNEVYENLKYQVYPQY